MPKRLILHTTNSKGYALFLALLPIIMVYRVPGMSIGLSTLMILIGALYAVAVIIKNSSKIDFKIMAPIMLYLMYVMVKGSGEDRLVPLIVLVHLFAISTGVIDNESLRKYIECFSCIASGLLILQVFVHMVSGFHIPMINGNLVLESLYVYWGRITYGYSSVENLYRPSAFFLEPAHFTQYCIVGLGSSLFRAGRRFKTSIMISIGILLTTSGMGFILTLAMWFWWYISRNGFRSLLRDGGRLLVTIFVNAIILYVLSKTKFFGKIINRFVQPSSSGHYNAIEGRFFWWNTYFGGLTWKDMVFGFGASSLPDSYFTGFMTVLYAYGIIGVVLFIFSYLQITIRGKNLARALSIMYIGLFFVANLTNMISLIFGFGVVLSFYKEDTIQEKTTHNKNAYNP